MMGLGNYGDFEWLKPGFKKFFRSQQMCDALEKAARKPAEECRAHIQGFVHDKSYKANVSVRAKPLTYTAVAVIRPGGRIERAVAAKHGIHD